ncbi:MAG: IclR family transcriptional regulator [Actinomycetes bacterium]
MQPERSDSASTDPTVHRHHSSLSSVASAARLLKEFAGDRQEMGVTEAARRLGLGKSTAHRLLNTLTEERLLERDPRTGAYRLGLAMYVLGRSVSTYSVLHEVCVPVMDQLRAATKAAVQVSVLDGREVVYVERRETAATLRMFGRIGHRFEANCTGSGKLLLAFLPVEQLDVLLDGWDLATRTEQSVADPAVLRAQLAEIRERGWAENFSETESEVGSVAAPIHDADGAVVAAISVVVPTEDLTRDSLKRYSRPCMDAAAAISRRLGYRPPTNERQQP